MPKEVVIFLLSCKEYISGDTNPTCVSAMKWGFVHVWTKNLVHKTFGMIGGAPPTPFCFEAMGACAQLGTKGTELAVWGYSNLEQELFWHSVWGCSTV